MGQTQRVFILFFSLLMILSFSARTRAEEPSIAVDNPEYNFGQVFAGTQVTHTFGFRNTGTAPLIIKKVSHSCGCTASLISSKTLEPGQRGEIKSTFDSTRFKGPVVKTIYLYSNDPVKSVMQLHMRGVVRKEITLHPSRISFGNLVPEVTVKKEVVIVNRGKNQIFIEDPQATTPELTASLSDRNLAPGQNLTVTILVTPKGDNRRLGGYVILPLSGAFLNEIQIPVYAEVIQPPQS